jgi:hypothetical protein
VDPPVPVCNESVVEHPSRPIARSIVRKKRIAILFENVKNLLSFDVLVVINAVHL